MRLPPHEFPTGDADVGGELVNLGVVELLDLLEHRNIAGAYKADGDTFAAEAPATPDTVQVRFLESALIGIAGGSAK